MNVSHFFAGHNSEIIEKSVQEVDKVTYGHKVSKDSCVVLQMNPQEDWSVECTKLYSRLEPLPRHKVFRIDDLYLYPTLELRAYGQHQQRYHPWVVQDKTLIYFVPFYYLYGIFLEYSQTLQVESSLQKKCSFVIGRDVHNFFWCKRVFVPIKVHLKTIEVPAKLNDLSFFESFHLPTNTFDSWITSTLFYVNCTEYKKEHSQMGLSVSRFRRICADDNRFIDMAYSYSSELYFLTPPSNAHSEKIMNLLLTLLVPRIQNVNVSIFGYMSVYSQASDSFCSGTYKACFANKNREKHCLTYNKKHHLHDYIPMPHTPCKMTYRTNARMEPFFFSKSGAFTIQLLPLYTMPSVFIKLTDDLKAYNKRQTHRNRIVIEIIWELKSFEVSNENQYVYRLFYSIKKMSWISAHKKCSAIDMSLPTFGSEAHFEEFLLFIVKQYGVKPHAVFVGLYKKASPFLWPSQTQVVFCSFVNQNSVNPVFIHSFQISAKEFQHTNKRPQTYFPLVHEKQLLAVECYLHDIKGSAKTLRGDDGSGFSAFIITKFGGVLRRLVKKHQFLHSQIMCFMMIMLNPHKPSVYPVSCKNNISHLIVCEQIPQSESVSVTDTLHPETKELLGAIMFPCSSGIFVSTTSLCDGGQDCEDSNDDEECTCYRNGKIQQDSSFCSRICQAHNCKCPKLMQQAKTGGCAQHREISFDEGIAFGSNRTWLFSCHDGSTISTDLVNDLIPDCKFGEDEALLSNMSNVFAYNCPQPGMIECFPGSIVCFTDEERCQYNIGETTKVLVPCRNGAHLSDCKHQKCGKRFKCKSSYCIPYRYICNGPWDCWGGEDEHDCAKRLCTGLFKCKLSEICIHLGDICDKEQDCPLQDDEYLCRVKRCPPQCSCLGFAVSCFRIVLGDRHSNVFSSFVFMDISFSVLPAFGFQWSLTDVSFFTFAHNNLLCFHSFVRLCGFSKIVNLNLRRNALMILSSAENVNNSFYHKLTVIDLSSNLIHTTHQNAFRIFPALHCLDLSDNRFSVISMQVFVSLPKLMLLNISQNPISSSKKSLRDGPELRVLLTEHYQICCLTHRPGLICTSKPTWPSTCERLLGSSLLHIFIWPIAFSIIFVNSLSSLWSWKFILARQSKANSNSRIYKVYVTAVNSADFTMGLYLAILSVKDSLEGAEYVEEDIVWRKSFLCFLLGGMSLFSIVFSSFLLLCLSITRLSAIRFPLLALRNKNKSFIILFVMFFTSMSVTLAFIFAKLYVDTSTSFDTPLCILFGASKGSVFHSVGTASVAVLLLVSMILTLVIYALLLRYVQLSGEKVHKKLGDKSLLYYLTLVCLTNILCWFPASCFYLVSVFQDYPVVLQYLVQLVVLPINPIMNPVLFNVSEIRNYVLQKIKPKSEGSSSGVAKESSRSGDSLRKL